MDILWLALIVFGLMYGCDLIEAIIARIKPREADSITELAVRRALERSDRG